MTRFEPATSGSTDRRSNQLSYIHHKAVLYFNKFQEGFANRPMACSCPFNSFYDLLNVAISL